MVVVAMSVVRTVTSEGLQAALALISDGTPAPGPITVILMAAGHVFGTNPSFVAAVIDDELVATGYSRQLNTVSSFTQQDDGTVIATFDPTSFGLVGGALNDTVGGCYLFADTGDDATSPIYSSLEFVDQLVTDGTELTIQHHPQSAVMAPSWI